MVFLKKWRVWAWHETDYGQRGCHVASMFLLQSQTLLLIGRTSRGTAWSWEFPPSLVEVRVYGKTQRLFPVFCHKCAYVLVMYWLCNGDAMALRDSPTCKKMKCNAKTISHNHNFCSTIMTSTGRNLVLPALSIQGEIKWHPVSKSSRPRPLIRSDSCLVWFTVCSVQHRERKLFWLECEWVTSVKNNYHFFLCFGDFGWSSIAALHLQKHVVAWQLAPVFCETRSNRQQTCSRVLYFTLLFHKNTVL